MQANVLHLYYMLFQNILYTEISLYIKNTFSDFQAWFLVYAASTKWGFSLDKRINPSLSALVREPRKKAFPSFFDQGHFSIVLGKTTKNYGDFNHKKCIHNYYKWQLTVKIVTDRKNEKLSTNLLINSLCTSHLPSPVGYKLIAGPPSQKVHAGYIISQYWSVWNNNFVHIFCN